MAAKKHIGIGDYVEVNGMWGYVQWIDDDMVRVSVDRDNGSRETVTYSIDEIEDDDHGLSFWGEHEESGLMETLKYAGITDPDDRPPKTKKDVSFMELLDMLTDKDEDD